MWCWAAPAFYSHGEQKTDRDGTCDGAPVWGGDYNINITREILLENFQLRAALVLFVVTEKEEKNEKEETRRVGLSFISTSFVAGV